MDSPTEQTREKHLSGCCSLVRHLILICTVVLLTVQVYGQTASTGALTGGRYASSMAGEIHKNVVLAPDEEIAYSQFVRERKNWLMAEPRLLAITAFRIILLEHNLFSADWVSEIPRSAVTRISREENLMTGWVEFTYSDPAEVRTVKL